MEGCPVKRLLLAFLVAASVGFVFQRAGYAQEPSPDPQASILSIRATDVADLRRWDAFVTAESRSGSLRLRSTIRDPLLPARVVERFDQYHDGVRIWGGDLVRDTERGVAVSIFGELSPPLNLSTEVGLSPEEARTALGRLGGTDGLLLTVPEVVVVRLANAEHRLAYTAVVSGNSDVVRAFIDAQSGAELLRYSEIQTQAATVGSGTGVLGDRKKLSVEANGGTHIAYDRHRPPVIQTFDMRGDIARTISVTDRGFPLVRGDLASDSDNVWTDPSVVDAHVHVSWTYDFYFKRFGRAGLDGRNGPINVMTNALSQAAALQFDPSSALVGTYVRNAFWCGSCNANAGVMFFGNGIPQNFLFSNGKTYTYLSGGLDVAAHELTHAVTDFTSRLQYHNESGALNEAFSDIMGKSVEFFYHPAGNGVGQADYVVGKDVVRAARAGALNGIRSMANPESYDQPDHYSRYRRLPDTPSGDNGGVHVNSGIPNQAFYLAIEGGTNRTSLLTVQGVGAANREQIERVFYRAFTTLLPSTANFSTARIATIQAARDLYGAGGVVERAVTQAWDAVGVTNTSSNVPQVTRLTTQSGTIASRTAGYYIVTMPATGRYQAVLNWSDTGVDLDLMISRPGCLSYSCMLTRAESATRRPETVCFQVSAGEQYWVHIESFGPRSTSYDLAQTISPSPTGPCALPAPVNAPTEDGFVKSESIFGGHREQLH
jgi:bacillolysin